MIVTFSPAARTIGLQLQVLKAKTAREEGFAWSERQRRTPFSLERLPS
jgi:hypothetical protein